MSVWLQSKIGRPFKLRDGVTAKDPVFIVDHDPVFFKKRTKEGHENDVDLKIVSNKKPLSDKAYVEQVVSHRERIEEEKANRPGAARRAEAEKAAPPANAFAKDTDTKDGPPDALDVKVSQLGKESIPGTSFTAEEDDD